MSKNNGNRFIYHVKIKENPNFKFYDAIKKSFFPHISTINTHESFSVLINKLVPIYPWVFKSYIDCKCNINKLSFSTVPIFSCPYLQCIDKFAREDKAIQYTIFYLNIHKGMILNYIKDTLPNPMFAPHLSDDLRIEEWTIVMRTSCNIIKAVKIIQKAWRIKKS